MSAVVLFLLCVLYLARFSCFLFFFFKQKTAYEMRISDWSSDVCSSDLTAAVDRFDRPHGDAGRFHIDEQEGDALLLAAAIVGAHQREHPVGMLRLRGPYLLAVDHIGVAIAIGPCLERREVRAGTG